MRDKLSALGLAGLNAESDILLSIGPTQKDAAAVPLHLMSGSNFQGSSLPEEESRGNNANGKVQRPHELSLSRRSPSKMKRSSVTKSTLDLFENVTSGSAVLVTETEMPSVEAMFMDGWIRFKDKLGSSFGVNYEPGMEMNQAIYDMAIMLGSRITIGNENYQIMREFMRLLSENTADNLIRLNGLKVRCSVPHSHAHSSAHPDVCAVTAGCACCAVP